MQATFPGSLSPYPVHVEGHLDRPSRGLWLIKWLLVIPHYIVLTFLWIGLFISALTAFAVVLFTGRYPRALFDFNVGVIRWTWRVGFYAVGANGTDRYPPFTLDDVPDYPARLTIDYPRDQRRGLPLIGWWLAGIPQYLIAGLLVGAGAGAGWSARYGDAWRGGAWPGLIGIVVLVGVVVLLFRGEYPRSIFDFALGLNRWVLRVLAYAAVMTAEYPPFRIDPGETEASGSLAIAAPAATPVDRGTGQDAPASTRGSGRWGPGRVIALVAAGLLGLISLGALAAGTTAIVFDQSQRNPGGYLMTRAEPYSTSTYAMVSSSYRGGTSGDWFINRELLGMVRIRVRSARPVFVGIGTESAVNTYLAGVAHARGDSLTTPSQSFKTYSGGAPSSPPWAQRFWSASTTGSGTRTVTWRPRPGNWRIVLMNANAAPNVSSEVSIGARFPHLLTIGIAVAGSGLVLLFISGGCVYLAVRRRS